MFLTTREIMHFNLKEFEALDSNSDISHKLGNCYVNCKQGENTLHLCIQPNEETLPEDKVFNFYFSQVLTCSRIGNKGYVFNFTDNSCYVITFSNSNDLNIFDNYMQRAKENATKSKFSNRTEESSASQYFQFYGYLSQQQNMLQDYIRTSTYERAVLNNCKDFQDKVVLDVGAGSGILSFFSVQAGASRVYAVEASTMATHAESLINFNYLSDKITVIPGKVEEIDLPEPVDIIISEPMGYMLFNERMLETYLHAKKWLKRGGKMFPTLGDLHVAPFTDEALYIEQTTKASFWMQTHFHNIDLTALHNAALAEYFRQPIVDTFDIRTCTARSICHTVNFLEADESDLHRIEIPLEFIVLQTATIHGLAFWFDVAFIGSCQTIWLSTSPTEPLTHWYQVRCLLNTPVFAREGQKLVGKVILEANSRQSYDVDISVMIEGELNTHSSNRLDLKNPYFRYTGQPTAQPPGCNTTSPTETYWNQVDVQNVARQVPDMSAQTTFDISQWTEDTGTQIQATNVLNNTVNMVNGISLNGYNDVLEVGHQPMTVLNINSHTQSLVNSTNAINSKSRQKTVPSIPTSTCAAQLIGGGISPNVLSNQTAHIIIPDSNHFPSTNAEMITEYPPADNE